MPPQNPYSSFADPNSFLGQPFLPRIASAISNMASSFGRSMGSVPPTPAGVRPIPQGASVPSLNPVPFLQSLNPLANTPLIGGMAQGRGQRQETPTPTVPTLPSGTPRIGFDAYPTMPQRIASENPRVATAEDIAAFREAGFTRPSQQVAIAPQPPPVPAAAPQRTGVQTPYGMVYPTRGQTAAAQRLSQMPRMGARFENVRQELNQQERIVAARQAGRQIARDIVQRNEDYFASQRSRGIRPIQVEPTQDRVAQRGQGTRAPLEGRDAEQLPRRQRRQRPFEQGVA